MTANLGILIPHTLHDLRFKRTCACASSAFALSLGALDRVIPQVCDLARREHSAATNWSQRNQAPPATGA